MSSATVTDLRAWLLQCWLKGAPTRPDAAKRIDRFIDYFGERRPARQPERASCP